MAFQSMGPLEQGWFLGQVDEVFSEDYDKDLYGALWKMSGGIDTHILYAEDKTRRAVVRFTDKYIETTVQEAGKLGIEVTPEIVARVAAAMCCFIGLAAGMNAQLEDWKEEAHRGE